MLSKKPDYWMKDLLEKFENKRPEIVFEWKDSETEAEGWVVITHSGVELQVEELE